MLALRGGTVVDVDGRREVDVAVEDGRIVAVGSIEAAADREVDVAGEFLAPGLVDAHVHLPFDARADPATYAGERTATMAIRAADNLEAMLRAGVVAVRDLGSADEVALAARDAVGNGTIRGPRVRAAGRNVVMTGGHGYWFGREADGPAEVRKAVREQLKAGADCVKCMATGGVLTEGAVTGAPELDRRELDALVEAARANGVPTAAHAHGIEGIENAVRAGVDSVEHGTHMDAAVAELMADRGTYWVPTASALHGILDAVDEASLPAYVVEKAAAATDAFDRAFDHALAAGVPIAMGTDAGTPFNEHGDAPRELALLVEHGLSPAAALEAGTVNAADLLGLDDVGRISEGYRADLVVLSGDPLDDAGVWQDPAAVFMGGEPVH